MKIVHIVLCGPVTDGFSYQDNLLTKYHKKMGFDVTIITSQWMWGEEGKLIKNERTNYQNENDVKVIRLQIKRKDIFNRKFKHYKGVKESLEVENPDILFIHGCQFMDMNVVVRYLKVHSSIKVYVDNHADFSNSGTNWLSKNVLHKILWRRSAHMIEPYTIKFYGVLPARVDWLIDMYKLPKNKCELLVMGADDDKVIEAKKREAIEAIRKKYGIGNREFLVVTGGKINHNRPETLQLMEAVRNSTYKNMKLLIFGTVNNELREKFESLLDGNRVIYAGWQDAMGTYKLMASANLVAFPGLHSVMWEQAVALGIPTIFRKIEGFNHIDIGGNCDYFDKLIVSDMQKKLEGLYLNKSQLTKMREIAERDGKNYFSYKNIAKKSIDLE